METALLSGQSRRFLNVIYSIYSFVNVETISLHFYFHCLFEQTGMIRNDQE